MKKYPIKQLDILEVLQYCMSFICALAVDENIYDVLMYGDSIGSKQYAQELSLGLSKQKIVEELLLYGI